LGLTGFCKKSKDNNDLALVAGLVVAEQQAQQAAQAAYEAANNTENRQSFCAQVIKTTFPGNSPTYQVKLTPLVRQDCNVNYWGFSTNAFRQRLLETINGDPDLSSNCPNTKTYISGLDFSSIQEKFIYKDGRSLLSEVNLDPTTYTVVSPNTYKLYFLLTLIKNYANSQTETNCENAVQNKIDSIPNSNKFCSNTALALLSIPACDSSSGITKAVFGLCFYGSSGSTCATPYEQF
jgi:hypothetical protein